MRIFLVRHGTTNLNERGVFSSNPNSDGLNEKGKEETLAISCFLKDMELELISSPIKRAIETAEIISMGRRIRVDDRLKEIHFGDWEGKEVKEINGYSKFFEDPVKNKIPRGEDPQKVLGRAMEVVKQVIERGRDTVLVSHGFVILSILTKALNMKLSDAFRLKVDTGSISLMEYNDRLRVIYINLKPLLLKDLCKCLKSA